MKKKKFALLHEAIQTIFFIAPSVGAMLDFIKEVEKNFCLKSDLRDEFAKASLAGFRSSPQGFDYHPRLAAKAIYEDADAMLSAREDQSGNVVVPRALLQSVLDDFGSAIPEDGEKTDEIFETIKKLLA